jgi:PilZ domain-containing protein
MRVPAYERAERRFTPRHHISMVGRITLSRGMYVDCLVRDFSPAGAGLWLKHAVGLPVRFDLHFDNLTRHCVVVWRRPYGMGVRFKSAP